MPARATPARERIALAFAPGHVTGVFAPDLTARDPRGRGSVGAGLVLEAGVHAAARWRPGGPAPYVRVRSESRRRLPISTEVAERIVGSRPGRLEVELRHSLPIGQGFGMSAAGALATGLAAARAVGAPRGSVLATAHLADLFGGGGLGGVASILHGGLEIRQRPGIPPFGRVLHRPFASSILLALIGKPIPSPALLRDARFLDRVRGAAGEAMPRLRARPDGRQFLAEAEGFTDRLKLGSPRLRRRIHDVRGTGARAAQSMFGESLFIVPGTERERRAVLRVLERSRTPAVELRSARLGAHLVGATERPGT